MKKFLVLSLVLFSFLTLMAATKGPKSMIYQEAFDYCNNHGMHLGDESEYKSFGISSGAYWQKNGCFFDAKKGKEDCNKPSGISGQFYCF